MDINIDLTLREDKGSELTYEELDANFMDLGDALEDVGLGAVETIDGWGYDQYYTDDVYRFYFDIQTLKFISILSTEVRDAQGVIIGAVASSPPSG